MTPKATIIFVILLLLFIIGVLIYGSMTETDFLDAFSGKVKTECPEGTYPIGQDDAGNVICHPKSKD